MSIFLIVALLQGCGTPPAEDAAHGHGHGHGGGGHAEEEDGESIAVTRWTDGYELFVELDAPVAGAAFAYHAHVTRMVDNHAATSGTMTLRFETDGFPAASHTDPAVARPGIFAAQAIAPEKPGRYRMFFSYVDGADHIEWDAGEVEVGESAGVPHEGEPEGEITFLKESQWQIPFLAAPSTERLLASTIAAAGVVHTSPERTAIVAAPVEGLVAWAEVLPVVGRAVHRGEHLATLIPAGAAEHWAGLQAELTTARIDRDLADTDLQRVEGLSEGELVSTRRLEEARAAQGRAAARVQAAQRRISAITSGGAGAIPIRAPADGLVLDVGAAHGDTVSAGTALVRVRTGAGILIEAQVQVRHSGALLPITSLSVRRGDWDAPHDLLAAGGVVLTEQLVYSHQTLSAPLSVLVPDDVGLVPGDLVTLSAGVGSGTPRLSVPRSAVVEINGQAVVFVQKTGESFTRRRVTLGTGDAAHVEVLSGLSVGEMIVVEGGFDVHVASLSGTLESHRH